MTRARTNAASDDRRPPVFRAIARQPGALIFGGGTVRRWNGETLERTQS